MARVRPRLALVFAIVAGLLLVFMDSRPSFDDTGVLVAGLVAASFAAVILDGTTDMRRALGLALLVGIWIPIFELALPGSFGAVIALALAALGAGAGLLVTRAMTPAHG